MERAALATGTVAQFQFWAVTGRSAVDTLSLLLHHQTEQLSISRSSIPRKGGLHRVGRFLSLLTHDISFVFNNTNPANLTNIFQHYLLPDNSTKWVINFTSNRTLSFSFDNNMEPPKSYRSGLPQGSLLSPILLLIYAQAMLNPLPQAGAVDASYIDNYPMLQTASSQESAVYFLVQRTHRPMERGAALNLPYDFAKSGLIHFFPKSSYFGPKNNDDLKKLPKAIINKNTTIEPSRTLRHLVIQIEHRLQMTPHAVSIIVTRKRTLCLIRCLRHNHHGIIFSVARRLIFNLLLRRTL